MKKMLIVLIFSSLVNVTLASTYEALVGTGTYNNSQIKQLLDAACSGNCKGGLSTNDTLRLVIPDGQTVSLANNSNWSLGSMPGSYYTYLFIVLEGTTSQLNFGTKSIELSETSGFIIDPNNNNALASSPGAAPKINFKNTDNTNLITYSANQIPQIIEAGGVSAESFGPPQPNTPLPVELLYFKGTYQNGEVELTWATATEINNDFFLIEKSDNGFGFEVVGDIVGNGNSLGITKYSTTIKLTSSQPITYFRLVQVDYDGTRKELPIIAVSTITTQTSPQLTLLPNPAIDYVKIVNTGFSIEDRFVYEIYNGYGSVVSRGENNFGEALSLEEFKGGSYMIKISHESNVTILRFSVR